MSAEPPSTRDRILQAAYSLFYREGFSRVSVDAIAERARLTKRTVYYHFKSKDDIAAAALGDLHRHLMPQFRKWAGPETAEPAAIVANLFKELQAWADRDTWLGSGFSRIAAELADMPGHPAKKAASSHKEAVERWLSQQLETAGLKDPALLARQIMVLIEGSMNLSLIHGNTQYIQAAGSAAAQLLAGAER
ncbi:TetR/AcrR family transcriptional regulator [Roseibium aggregatum]|uniref:TetR/AcrR family transcriptional regulator n=1 Tax=Roseibium aggregatum TaxID=187304 RepID=A0A926S4C4_9HYPH|nr:TetR/AcrR family transcriptional regulator [Roseibium aggregatum]MBD1546233.1 TetR/AcrR family transcriptional regulator [Roseibium aggregatum]